MCNISFRNVTLPDWLDVVGFRRVTVRGGGGGGTTGSKCRRILDFSMEGLRTILDKESGSAFRREELSLILLVAYVLCV